MVTYAGRASYETVTPYETSGPPEHEVPAQVTVGIVWRNPSAVLSIPEMFAYAAGLEIAVLYRAEDKRPAPTPETVGETFRSMKEWRARLARLKVNGAGVAVQTLQLHERGFTARVWSSFASHQVDRPENAIRFELDWPEFDGAAHTVPYVARGPAIQG
jgi:hypothetical protein